MLDLGKHAKEPTLDINTEPTQPSSHQNTLNTSKPSPRKFRKSNLPYLSKKYNVSEAIRLNTLEKSKLDWNKFVVEEGIKEDLKMKNRDGYIEKIGFLNQTDERMQDVYSNLFKKKKK